GLRALLPRSDAGRVLTWLERTRAASLLTVEAPAGEVEADVIALRSVEHELRVARRERGEEPRELLARQGALEARIRRRSWGHDGAAVGASGEVALASELRVLLDGAWLAEYASVDDRILAVVVGPRRTRLVELGALP